jgi:hypothetical protein
MGFWGTFVVHRDRRLLEELLPDVAAFGEAELCYDGVSGGWQVTRVFAPFDDLPAGFLEALADLTGAPVLAAGVMDSDAALVSGLGRDTPGWKAWLQLDRAMAFLVPARARWAEDGRYLGDGWEDPDQDRQAAAAKERILAEAPGGPAAAAAAMAWAGEADLEPATVEEVTEAFNGNEVFVEDLFFTLINRLGIAIDKVQIPERPAVAEVLRSLLGNRLDTIDLISHRPVRGERLDFPGMTDMRLHFDGQPAVTACACGHEFFVLPPAVKDDSAKPPAQPVDVSFTRAVSGVAGRRLTNAATVRHQFLPFLKGVALRFGNRDLVIVAIDGKWAAAAGATPVKHLMDELGPDQQDEIHLNAWLAS